MLLASSRAKGRSCRGSEWNNISFLCYIRCEAYLLRLRNAVLTPQVAIGFHRNCPAVFVPEPTRDSRNVHARFDAARGVQVPEIVMRQSIGPDFFTRSIKGLLAFANAEHLGV